MEALGLAMVPLVAQFMTLVKDRNIHLCVKYNSKNFNPFRYRRVHTRRLHKAKTPQYNLQDCIRMESAADTNISPDFIFYRFCCRDAKGLIEKGFASKANK